MKKLFFIGSLCLAFLLGTTTIYAAVIYVDVDANGANNGTSWNNAYEDLQLALAAAGSNDEIWVAAGIYKPTTTNDRDIAFVIPNGVELYGGFVGTETQRSQRNWGLNATILSGAIGSSNDETDNTRVLILVENAPLTVTVDGFHLRKTYNNDSGSDDSPVYVNESLLVLKHCQIYDNVALSGSAVQVLYSMQSTVPDVLIDNCLIYENTCNSNSGEVIICGSFEGQVVIKETTITKNEMTGTFGHVITGQQSTSQGIGATCLLYNSIIWDNTYSDDFFTAESMIAQNNILQEDLPTVGVSGGINIDLDNIIADPEFIDPVADNYSLKLFSPAINTGNNFFNESSFDVAKNNRIFESTVDMGCYENQIGGIIYVDVDANGLNNGTSWTNAYEDLQSALSIAAAGVDIWVAEGYYYPTSGTNRDISFVIPDGVNVYGGFDATETERSQRNWDVNVTRLSGNIGNLAINTDNSRQVVDILNANINGVILDGFTVQDGYDAVGSGAAIFSSNSVLELGHCDIRNNTSNLGSALQATLSDVIIDNCLIKSNTILGNGGIINGFTQPNSITIIECTIVENNMSTSAGRIIGGTNGTPIEIYNSILWDNQNTGIGPTLNVTAANCIIEGGYAGSNIINADPLFVSPPASYALDFLSPARNAGSNTYSISTKDLYHQTRKFDGTVDMGCAEVQDDGVIYVDSDATGLNDGTSWANAYTSLQTALAAVVPGNEIWVAGGTYKPTTNTDRFISFDVPGDIELYGGFGGFETNRTERDWGLFPTILSGAIGTSADTDNTNILMWIDGDNVVLDGFDLRKAYHDGHGYGAALLVFGDNFEMKHCSVHNNFGTSRAGFNFSAVDGVVSVSDCLFYDNECTEGEVFGLGAAFMTVEFTNCTFTRNSSTSTTVFSPILEGHYIFKNCILWNHDEVLFDSSSIVDAYNSIIEDLNEVELDLAINVQSVNPNFTAPGSDDFTIELWSPAHNSGDNSLTNTSRDLSGNDRVFEDIVDMGCYENQTPSIYYVDIDASGLNNGTNWQDAYPDLQEALNNAVEGQQIWVAAGTYKTSTTNNRSQSFVLKNDVPVYGGFAGTETSIDQRDWFTNITNLSGNIGNIASTADNAYHVLFADDEFGSFYVDGFSIFGGNANGALVHEDIGAAALIEFSEGTFTMANCFVFNNFAEYTGGAVSTFANSVFLNTSFVNNEAHIGGAISWSNGTYIENCLFLDNTADIGIVDHNTSGTLDMRGCTFEGNTVAWDVNSIVSGGNGTVANTVIWGNTLFDANEKAITLGTEVHHCILQGAALSSIDEGEEVYYEDPHFINAAGLNFGLSGESVGANGGDNSLVTTVYDIVGNERIRLGTVDIGAVEGVSAVPGIIYVDDNASGANNGSSWIDAYTDFQSALTASAVGDEIWVAGGWYRTTPSTNRDIRFEMKDSLQIYGGFAGVETDRNARDWSINKSQLTGDIGSETNTDNAKLLLNLDSDQGVLIDGFSLRGSYEDPTNGLFGATAISAYNSSTLTLRHCEIFDNTSYAGSGATVGSNSVSIFDNCLFHDNLINAGGILNTGISTAYIKIYSSTIAGNHMIQSYARPIGGDINAKYDIYNSIIWDNENSQNTTSGDVDITNCIIEGYVQDSNDTLFTPMISIDPQFLSPNTGDPDYTLLSSSIAVNTGSNSNSILVYDLNHNLRIQNGTIDIGAYEQSSCGQTNDDCAGALTLAMDGVAVMGSTKCATGGDSPSNACAANTGKTVWYKFTAPYTGQVNVNANYLLPVTANFNLRLSLYSGSCGALTYVNCVNANGNAGNETLNVTGLVSNTTYYIRVDAPSSQEGVFMIDVDTVVPDCPGDFDHNGTVGVSDLLIFTGAFGCTSSCGETDMDSNGSVNVTDLLLFIAQFGSNCE